MAVKKVLVTGDRNGFSPWRIHRVLKDLFEEGYDVLVHGGARGVDTIAGEVGASLGYEVRVYPADWERYGRGAGPIRNKHMLVMEMPDLVVAFHRDLKNSRGTQDCLIQAEKMNIPRKVIRR